MYTASAFIDLAPMRRPTGAPTPSRLLAEKFARTLPPGAVVRFDRGLQNIELAADQFVRGRINALHPRCSPGASVMDGMAAGDVLVVYADGRIAGAVGMVSPPLSLLQDGVAIRKGLSASERRRSLIDTAISLRPKTRPKTRPTDRWAGADELQAVALDLTVIASLLIDESELEVLASIQGAVPTVAIVALTDMRGRPTVDTRHTVTRFPGQWLGTSSPAGFA